MSFVPVVEKYRYDKNVLTEEIPNFIISPIRGGWLESIIYRSEMGDSDVWRIVVGRLRAEMREEIPYSMAHFMDFVCSDNDRLLYIIQFFIDIIADESDLPELNCYLRESGTCWEAKANSKSNRGGHNLCRRVPLEKQEVADRVFGVHDEFRDVWMHCYGLNPDYNKVVQECQNLLEKFIKDKYFPNDDKPQLGKFLGNIKVNPTKLQEALPEFIGYEPLVDLLANVPKYRGVHTAGSGKNSNRSNAEAILLTTMYFLDLHNISAAS